MDDFRRILIRQGHKEIKKIYRRNRDAFKRLDCLFSSPLVRAVETADIIWNKTKPHSFELLPSLDKLAEPAQFISDIGKMDKNKSYCFTGHDPHLSEAIKILTGAEIELKKGGIITLEGKDIYHLKITSLDSPV